MSSQLVFSAIIAFISGLIVAFFSRWFGHFLSTKTKGKLAIIEDSIDFSASSNNEKAMDLFKDNKGLALFVSFDVEGISELLIYKLRLDIRVRNIRVFMSGILCNEKKTLKLTRGEIASLKFIFDPTSHTKDLAELFQLFLGSVYSFSLYNHREKKVGQISSKRIIEIKTVSSMDVFTISIPHQKEEEDALRIKDILETSGICGIELKVKRVDKLSD